MQLVLFCYSSNAIAVRVYADGDVTGQCATNQSGGARVRPLRCRRSDALNSRPAAREALSTVQSQLTGVPASQSPAHVNTFVCHPSQLSQADRAQQVPFPRIAGDSEGRRRASAGRPKLNICLRA